METSQAGIPLRTDPLTDRNLARIYKRSHDIMRNIDGLQPQEALDELLKMLFTKQFAELKGVARQIEEAAARAPLDKPSVTAGPIREAFIEFVQVSNSWIRALWPDGAFHMSDQAIAMIYRLFDGIEISSIPFDVRSAAVRQFLSSDVRRSLGIYLTPDSVIKMMTSYCDPDIDQIVYDPACGTGSFLVEVAGRRHSGNSRMDGEVRVLGTDKNPRMLAIADLNLGHFPNLTFERYLMDALFPGREGIGSLGQDEFADVILTNPPFGVSVEGKANDLRRFITCRSAGGAVLKKQHSEILFIEQCLRYLKPGGMLGIVVPRSILTNSSFEMERREFGKLGYLQAVVYLPPETFAQTGTMATTAVLFVRKYENHEHADGQASTAFSEVENVGYDSTGRSTSGNQLTDLPTTLRECVNKHQDLGICTSLGPVNKRDTFSRFGELIASQGADVGSIKLGEIVELVRTGRTPARRAYAENGLFVVKVGNLTGNGINWRPRDRNFVGDSESEKRLKSANLILREGDILLTSSAHSPKYIAAKVDIIESVPTAVGGKASYVGEVMLIRLKPDTIDPYILVAHLRSSAAKKKIQSMIRGQTAHLYSADLQDLPIPSNLSSPEGNIKRVAKLIRSETELNHKLRENVLEQDRILREEKVLVKQ